MADGEYTDPDELAVGEHAALQASVQEIHMVLHEFVHRPIWLPRAVYAAVLSFKSGHERLPVRLDDLQGAKVQQLLDEDDHASPQRPDPPLPYLQPPGRGLMTPYNGSVVGLPGRRQL